MGIQEILEEGWKFGVGGLGVFFVKWAWDRYWGKQDHYEASMIGTVADHGNRIISAESRLSTNEVRESERQKLLGKMEGENALH